MITIDANILLYAYNEHSLHYAAARRWLDEVFASEQRIGLPFQSILAFIRISTNPKLPGSPQSISAAISTVETWLALPNVLILAPDEFHWSIFKKLCIETALTGNLSTDAHLAALTIENDATLCTTDRDFARFPGLRWQNPLVP